MDAGSGRRSSTVVRDPDPKSRAAYTRLIGYSSGAEFVLTVIIDSEDFSGVTAWKTRGIDLRHYSKEGEPVMSDTTDTARAARRARHEAIRAEVAVEEAEAVEKANTLDVPMHLRIDSDLDGRLRQRARGEGIPTSALVRRLLRQAMQQGSPVLSQADVEDIARRVAREELQSH